MVRRIAVTAALVAAMTATTWGLVYPRETPPIAPMAPDALRQWLTVISSDEFEGRATFSPGLDKAAHYIADRLKDAGVEPGGENGFYFQPVPVESVQSLNVSTLTVDIGDQS